MNSRTERVRRWRGATSRSQTMDRRSSASAGDELVPSEVGERSYRPVLKKAGLTQAVAFDPVDAADKSAAAATSVDGRQALPAIVLRANERRPQRDLLAER